MIRLARREDLPAVKELWMQAFHDAKEATDFYFENRLPQKELLEDLLLDSEGGRLRGMLSLLPIDLAYGGRAVPARYYFAIATDEAFRGLGVSTALMEEAHRLTLSRGGQAALLVPASESLFRFYGKRGFDTLFVYEERTVSAADIAPRPADAKVWRAEDAGELLRLRDAAFSEGRLFARWDEQALGFMIKASRAWQAPLLRFSLDGAEGYAWCERAEGAVLVKELALRGLAPEQALSILHAELGAERYVLRLPVGAKSPEGGLRPCGMIRWLKAAPALPGGGAPYLGLGKD